MAVNVSGTVQVGGVNVSAQVETHGVNATATVQRSNTEVSASVEHRSANVSATAQTRNTNVCASVNPHIMPGGTSDHAQLQNLDYDNAGHTGFQRELIPDESITIDEEGHIHANGESYTAGQNINIDEDNVISAVDTIYTQGNGITIDQDNVISNDVYPLVPPQATPENQLADKDFVNSSIATSTATFRGTYNVVTDLHLSTSSTHQQVATALDNTISIADNNDYCFVEIPTDDLTPTETLHVDRYKYNGSSWSFEYTLNNSGYTSAQWKAINSGITSGKVTQYDGYATSKQDVLTAGSHITINNNVISANITPVFLGKYNLVDDLGLSIGATESQIATALANTITTAIEYDYCLVEIPDYQVYNGYSAFASVDDYIDYYVIYNSAYELVTNSNKSSLGIVPKTTVAYILNNAYSVVRYNFDGTDWTSADNSGYANVDASNFTDSGTTFLSGLGMPDWLHYEIVPILASNSQYTAPANGWFFIFGRNTATTGGNVNIRYQNTNNYSARVVCWSRSNDIIGTFFPVKENDIISINYTSTVSFTTPGDGLVFIYAEGTPTPPQP